MENKNIKKINSLNVLKAMIQLQASNKPDNYVLCRNGEQVSLLKLQAQEGAVLVSHYDLYGRPMTEPMKQAIESIPGTKVRDVSREERYKALYDEGGFAAFQEVHNMQDKKSLLENAVAQLTKVAVEVAAAAAPVSAAKEFANKNEKFSLFSRKRPREEQVIEAPDKKMRKPN